MLGASLRGDSSRGPPIGVPSVRDANHQNDELIVPDFVHHAVVPNPEPPQTPQVAF